ncbi:choline monooxygenase, chloroplastic-like [Branchiostoma floridae]|uniref:Choline monooxygenase, chloroplastic-like n=1 Tax=Branchiostoma floridae TaxID=7739 RepID=A0A9J7MKQ8_BRAFL|nr:choline monooxygenase, chloroplastic-like [Branchiostoma floridae]XP_035670821.1 choline monooxygenase, chloroplastic-like [Branchiostoma floridae]
MASLMRSSLYMLACRHAASVRIFRPFSTTADRRFTTADRRFTKTDRRFTKINVDRSIANEVLRFSLDDPVHEALTPPSSWYKDSRIHDLEARTVWRNNWVAVGRTDQVSTPGAFFTGTIGREPFIVSSDKSNTLRAFYNVCCHHGNIVEFQDAGEANQFVCCYHGWTYGLDGRLTKPTKLRGIKNFTARGNGLKPIAVRTWGPLVFLRLDGYVSYHAGLQTDESASAFVDKIIKIYRGIH